jgi:carnitine O-acetyltransferase
VCLDTDAAPGSLSGLSAVMRDGNSHNRFYDKSMQIIVMENGTAGLCFERAAVDGSVALGFAARLQRESLNLPACGAEAAQQQSAVRIRAADWFLSAALKRRLQAAKKYIAAARAQRGIEAWIAPHFGTRRLKALDISPDAVVQLAIQLAAREVTGRMPTVFEPVQIRHFAGGRMDFIVPVTAESLEAVRSLRTANANQYFAAVQIRRAAKAHQNLVLHTKSGRGLIAHLLALNAIQGDDAARNGERACFGRGALWPRLDKGLQVLIRQDVLAANGSGFTGVASFGPIGPRPNMLSIGYLINEDAITFELRADGRYSGQARALRAELDKALLTIEKLLASCKQGEPR